jgi:hypothetical protein
VPFYIARKPAKAMLPNPLPSGFWDGVTLCALQRVSADVNDFMSAYARASESATVADFSLHLGGVPPEEGSLWFCILHSAGILSELPSWNFEELATETRVFESQFHFFPNPARLLQQSHLPEKPWAIIKSAASRAKKKSVKDRGEKTTRRRSRRGKGGSGS